MAFPVLRPVFQVLCAIFVAAAAQFFLHSFLGIYRRNFLILTVGLVVGWFIGKMLTEHTTRVFRLTNFYGLAALAAVFAVSLWLTHVDILGIETRLPDPEQIKKVTFVGREFTEREDIDNILRLQTDALEHRAEKAGTYVLVDGEWIHYIDTNADRIDEENPDNKYTYVDELNLTYEMESGKLIRRHYYIWVNNDHVDSEAGRIAESYLTDWDTVNSRTVTLNGVEHNRLELILQDPEAVYVDFMDMEEDVRQELATPANLRSLVTALKADCTEGNLAQNSRYHTGAFRIEDEYAESGYQYLPELGISISGEKYTWWVSIYPDSSNTIQWLQRHNVLNAEVLEEDITYLAR